MVGKAGLAARVVWDVMSSVVWCAAGCGGWCSGARALGISYAVSRGGGISCACGAAREIQVDAWASFPVTAVLFFCVTHEPIGKACMLEAGWVVRFMLKNFLKCGGFFGKEFWVTLCLDFCDCSND